MRQTTLTKAAAKSTGAGGNYEKLLALFSLQGFSKQQA
jgi:hypothetical protein